RVCAGRAGQEDGGMAAPRRIALARQDLDRPSLHLPGLLPEHPLVTYAENEGLACSSAGFLVGSIGKSLELLEEVVHVLDEAWIGVHAKPIRVGVIVRNLAELLLEMPAEIRVEPWTRRERGHGLD